MKTTAVLAPPRGRTVVVERARPEHEHESKRLNGLVNTAKSLDKNRDLLEEQTIAKNREFKRRVDALHTRKQRVYGKQDEEIRERDAEYKDFVSSFELELKQLKEDFESKLHATFDELENTHLKKLQVQTVDLERDINHFMKVTVPQVIETQSGEVVRYMKRERQAFEFDNIKIMQREVKIVERAGAHEVFTKECFGNEEVTCFKTFQALGEDIDYNVRDEDRAEERLQTKVIKAIKEVQISLEDEKTVRCDRDITCMAGLESSLSHIQKVIIENFGTGGERALAQAAANIAAAAEEKRR